jgi:hypothetical protein
MPDALIDEANIPVPVPSTLNDWMLLGVRPPIDRRRWDSWRRSDISPS